MDNNGLRIELITEDLTPEPGQTMLNPNPHAGAPLGNTNAMKFKTPESRLALCKAYCENAEQGYTDSAFEECDMDTFERYCKDFPIDFPTDMIDKAKRKRQRFWEALGIQGTAGKLKGFNANSWQFNMQNRFKWTNRQDVTSDGDKIDLPMVYIPQEQGENAK